MNGPPLSFAGVTQSRVTPPWCDLDNGALLLDQDARLRVHGVVYVNGGIVLRERTRVDIVGAMLSNAPVVAWVAAWQELP